MAELKNLLVELGCEELPPKALDELARAFGDGLADELRALGFAPGASDVWCSPRRMAVRLAAVAATAPLALKQLKGVPKKVGWDSAGRPTAALVKKAAQLGVDPTAFRPESDADNAMLVCEAQTGGETLASLLPAAIERALKRLPIPKPMRWGDHDYAFVRPVHWLVILHGETVVPAEILGVRSGRESRGHRFHHPQPVQVAHADAYLDALRAAKVLADPAERRARVVAEVARIGATTGGTPRLRDALRDEIANLTEWPVAIGCSFERDFLRVPQEALIQTMETNQKFVPVFADQASALSPRF
jgi:glycyl-tRNA synthetase beta chain